MMNLHDVAAAPIAAEQSNAAVMQFLFLGLIVVAFYFFLIRPQRNRQRRQQQLQNSVRPGARIMTTNGMYATVVAVDDDGIVLEIAPGVEARFVKQAIMQIVEQGDAADDAEDELDDDRPEDADEPAEERAASKSSSKPSA
ncbi:MAG TPA: preprotein translocase subunit YajC [Streptosporangiaceae bacterium]|nr:preprotein translocase subunit YajC [Streptosporangiaceae bacterium]